MGHPAGNQFSNGAEMPDKALTNITVATGKIFSLSWTKYPNVQMSLSWKQHVPLYSGKTTRLFGAY